MDDPWLLILETSGRAGAVGLARGPRLVRVRDLDEARRHAQDLAPAVKELLAADKLEPRDISGVLVSRGPGSYTGLRVGIMSAKAFAYATRCALIGVETFAALAWQTPEEAKNVEVVADAQQGKIYAQTFSRREPDVPPAPSSSLAIQSFSEWLARRDASAWVTGPGLGIYGDRLPPQAHMADRNVWRPRPESLLQLAWPRFFSGARDDLWELEPLYGRPSSAEENRQKRLLAEKPQS